MVENQHRKITGYRDLSEDEISLINEIKDKGEELGDLVMRVGRNIELTNEEHGIPDSEAYRWLAIGKTQLQQGVMSVTRAVARPDSF